MAKLAFFLPNLGGGGAERMMMNLAQGLVERGLTLDMVLAKAEGPYLSTLPDGVRVVDLKAGSVVRSVPGLVRYLREEQPEVLLSTLHYANLAALTARRLAGTRTRVFLREANMLSVGNSGTFKNRTILTLVKRLYPWSSGVVAVSEGVAADVKAFVNIPEEKVHTVYNPVVTDDLCRQCEAPVAHRWLETDVPVFLGVGRLTEQKDFTTLIRAFAEVRSRREARLIILGEGEQRAKLQGLVAELGLAQEVDLPGFVDNPFAFMSRASVFVLSSAWEGLPGVLIQALACGCPAVSTDCPSGPHEVLEGGRYGKLVPVGDVAAMTDAMLHTLETPLRSEDLKRRAQAFSVAASTRAYLELFDL